MYKVPEAAGGFADLGWIVKYPRRIDGILEIELYPEN